MKKESYRKWSKFKRFIYKRWTSTVISLGTIAFGLQLLFAPGIFKEYRSYQLLNELFDYRLISLIFIVVGTLNLIGMVFKIKRMKRFSLSMLAGLWTLFGLSFLNAGTPNTIYITALMPAAIVFGIAVKEEA